GRSVGEWGMGPVGFARIVVSLDRPVVDEEGSTSRRPVDGSIRFRDVGFGYREDESGSTIHGISLDIADGETVAFVGPSGCGKSTLVQLLLRYYDPASGSIEVGGVDVREVPRRELRAGIATVLQQPFLFSRSIRENILLADPAADRGSIELATNEACIHESIMRFEAGYETMVGERGVTLSGGQRQRIAIAQAMLQDPSILVLDDALSAVDTGTEGSILEAIWSRRGRHTTLIIAHRLSTLREADRIVVMSEGRIDQVGTHAELRDRPGLYRRLWEIQASLEAQSSATTEPGDGA
ncbi:MAG: ABC transporter ATP-binding protein, partial [Planctomycetota bacterium]|nr:ABC transporter ATP-binding protein [Planctomycetota bacterium]